MVPFLNHITIVGMGSSCIVGFFLALVFVRQKKKNAQINWVMGLLLITLACSVALNGYLANAVPVHFPLVNTLPEPFLLFIGPLFYEYIQRLSGSNPARIKTLWHSIPFLVVSVGLVALALQPNALDSGHLRGLVAHVWLAIYIQYWVYFLLNRRLLKHYRGRLMDQHSALEGVYQSWINYCLNALFIVYSVLGIIFFLQHGHIFFPINWSLALVLAFMIYCISYRILVDPKLFTQTLESEEQPLKNGQKYRKSGLSEEAASLERERLLRFMQGEKPFTDPDLDLKMLAHALQLTPHYLSQIINETLETSFYDFVNGYRVVEAKRLLSDPKALDRTVIQLAFEAGFNSKATFNRIFKKVTLQTPTQYRRAMIEKEKEPMTPA